MNLAFTPTWHSIKHPSSRRRADQCVRLPSSSIMYIRTMTTNTYIYTSTHSHRQHKNRLASPHVVCSHTLKQTWSFRLHYVPGNLTFLSLFTPLHLQTNTHQLTAATRKTQAIFSPHTSNNLLGRAPIPTPPPNAHISTIVHPSKAPSSSPCPQKRAALPPPHPPRAGQEGDPTLGRAADSGLVLPSRRRQGGGGGAQVPLGRGGSRDRGGGEGEEGKEEGGAAAAEGGRGGASAVPGRRRKGGMAGRGKRSRSVRSGDGRQAGNNGEW